METSPSQEEMVNTGGAVIFVFYVVAAITFTGFICLDLVNTYLYLPRSLYQKHGLQKNVQIFAGLATLSFSFLSYHMMDYLIESYLQWANYRSIRLPVQLYGKGGLLGPASERTPLYLWTWLSTSTLFYNFARTICEPYEHYIWTEQALLVTMGWCLFMSIEGELSLPERYLSLYKLTSTQVLGDKFDTSGHILSLRRYYPYLLHRTYSFWQCS